MRSTVVTITLSSLKAGISTVTAMRRRSCGGRLVMRCRSRLAMRQAAQQQQPPDAQHDGADEAIIENLAQ